MKLELTPEQSESRDEFRSFADSVLVPHAEQYDREQCLPQELVALMAQRGYLGANVPASYGGAELDMITFGVLHEEIGRGCSSTRSLLTVHSMVSHAITRWGSEAQRTRWLADMAAGETIGAFALSEPGVGSDAKSIQTTAQEVEGGFALNGHKRWITFGQIADLFLTFARLGDGMGVFLMPRSSPGLTITPIHNMLGTRASMLAELHFEDCRVPTEALLRRQSFGLGSMLTNVLDIGRYSVACGSVGIAQASLEASAQYASERKQFGVLLREHQLIRQMLSDMLTGVRAARLLCYQAGYSKGCGESRTLVDTLVAKYFASTTAVKAASDAVQIHGANGCSDHYPVQRYFRDARVMEIIEGSSQIQQLLIAQYATQE